MTATTSGGYHAIEDRGKRRPPRTATAPEEKVLRPRDRRRLTATLHEQYRNFELAQWIVQTHLDNVVPMTLQATTRDPGYNQEIEDYFRWRSGSDRADVARRHDIETLIELAEISRLIDGDGALLKLSDGRVQGIEGDRIALPTVGLPEGVVRGEWEHGIKTSRAGRPLKYMICNRDGSRLAYDRQVAAGNVLMHGWYSRHDQLRGVSPLASCLSRMQDLYETLEYNLLKSKIHALVGIVFKRRDPTAPMPFGGYAPPTDQVSDTGDDDSDTTDDAEGVERYNMREVLAGYKPFAIDLDDEDEVDTIQSNHPSSEFQSFTDLEIYLILSALGIPQTYWDARKGSYTIQLADRQRYARRVRRYQRAVRRLRDAWTVWQIELGIYEHGTLSLPSGWTMRDVRWEWQPEGTDWLNPAQEVKAAQLAIQLGIDSPQQIAKRRGGNHEDVLSQCATAWSAMREAGLPLDAWSSAAAPLQAGEIYGEEMA